MKTRTLDKATLNKSRDEVDYIAFMITEFSLKHQLTMNQSFNYLYRHGGIAFLDEFYDIEHCENPNLTLDALYDICKQNGGKLCK